MLQNSDDDKKQMKTLASLVEHFPSVKPASFVLKQEKLAMEAYQQHLKQKMKKKKDKHNKQSPKPPGGPST